jgi:hypothetical protein
MNTLIRRGAAALTGLLLAVAWVCCSVDAAWAGGPTSVIMVNPGSGRAAALHTTDVRYDRLVDAVHAYDPPAGSTTRPASVTDCSGCEIRLTWLIHDMRIWRIDRVHLTPEDGIWLESVSDESGSTDPFEQTGTWQRPHDPTALHALLRSSGLTAADGGDPADDTSAAGAAGAADLAAVGGGVPSPPLGLVAVGSGIVGVAVGLAIGYLVRRRRDADRVVLSG